MTATFLSYSIASRAMEASQASINIVGNNISNVNTEGYTRQRVDVVSVTTSGKVEKYANPQVSTGIGAKAKGTTQLRDPYIDARYRAQNAETSRLDTMVKGLSNLEDIFDEASTEALQGEISSFINDLQDLTTSPTSSDIKQVVRSAAEKVTEMINMYANQLDQVRVEQTENLNVVVENEFNTYAKNIASLNEQIQKEEIYGNTPNELYDQRNLLIDKLSSVASIRVSNAVPPDYVSENLTIDHYRISLVDPSDPTNRDKDITLIDNGKYSELSLDTSTATNVKLSIIDTTKATKSNINDYFIDGSIKGYVDIINGNGIFANASATPKENDAKGINYYSERIDSFARTFAAKLNDINNDAITSTVPTTVYGLDLFTNASGTATTGITAKNIQISTAWQNDPAIINSTTNSSTKPASEDNIVRMIEAMNDKSIPFKDLSGNIITTGTFNEYMTGMVTEVSSSVDLQTTFYKTATNVFQTISDSRDSVSGVSLNEEGVNLSSFQKVYSAAIRYFNVLDENLDNIINTMGV